MGQGNEVSIVPVEITNGELREALLSITRALTNDVNMAIAPTMNVFESTMISRIRDI